MSCQHARARIHSALSLTLRALSLSPQAKAEKKKGKSGFEGQLPTPPRRLKARELALGAN